MKKYTTNKSKLILAALTVPMVVSVLPVENVFAAENEVPTLRVYDNNGTPKLEWATEILEQNVLQKINFEDNMTTQISLNPGGLPASRINQEIITGDAFEGLKSLKVGATINGQGNAVYFPATSSNTSSFYTTSRVYLEQGMNLSVSMKVKTKGTSSITAQLNGPLVDYPTNIATTKYNIKVGDNYFYTDTPTKFFKNQWIAIYQGEGKGNYSYGYVIDVDNTTGKVTLGAGYTFKQAFKAGDYIKQHANFDANFNSKKIDTNGEWETINFNLNNLNPKNYSLDRGLRFFLNYVVNEELIVDDIKFGYATQVEVFREGTSIYKGYLSDFQDTTIKDTVKPNQVSKVNTTVSNDFKVNFTPVKPTDKGVTTNYTIQSIAQNGTRSAMSAPQQVTVGGEVTKYKYSVTKSVTAPSTLTNTTTGLDFNLPLNTLNVEQDYVHIQAVDTAGNVSSIQTFKLSELIDMTELQSLYDKLNSVEDSGNYDNFLTFVDEVEGLYGTNIPQDVKDRIQQLASYHGENTAFLELLEGDFSLTTKDITSFGKVKLTAEKQILKTNFADNFTVIDARGTQQGWKVNVSATPFIEDTFNGFVGEATQLPIGTLAVNTVRDIEQVGLVHESKSPSPFTNDFAIIDSGEVTVLNADKGHGMGEFKFNFGDDALSMVVDSTTAKIDNVNYPEGVTPYTSTITWNLITGP